MKKKILEILYKSALCAYEKKALPSKNFPDIEIEEPKLKQHGDYSTNIAMVMASLQKMAPRKIAQAIIKHIDDPEKIIVDIQIEGPGFINFFINKSSWYPVLQKIHKEDTKYGASKEGNNKKFQVEFVSANPTGPLHVGHGRCAAVGDSVANILLFCGYNVEKEYYTNDSGRQINTLGRSVLMRYKELFKSDVIFPDDCYQGSYIRDLAIKIKKINEKDLLTSDEDKAVSYCAHFAADNILADIKNDLNSFGVDFDNWFSEQSLFDLGKVDSAIANFYDKNFIYLKDGAKWFKTKDFGDEKDRVVVRKNGQTTYFASDIAYHMNKFERKFEKIINVWGADHHGYIPRVSASIKAQGIETNRFNVILVQLVNLLRDGKQVAMSTRAGEFVTLKDLIKEVGSDAARFIFLTHHHESPLDFDIEIAKRKTNDNPVYYVQYVHARISSIIRKSREKNIDNIIFENETLEKLVEPEEIDLIKNMARFPEVIKASAKLMEPHRIPYYLIDLASLFHSYYNKHKVLSDDFALTKGRLYLILAVKKVIRNGLNLLGVSAPEKM